MLAEYDSTELVEVRESMGRMPQDAHATFGYRSPKLFRRFA
jgi:hypothetical protein